MELDDTDAGLLIFVAFSDLSSIVQLLSGIDSRRNAHHHVEASVLKAGCLNLDTASMRVVVIRFKAV